MTYFLYAFKYRERTGYKQILGLRYRMKSTPYERLLQLNRCMEQVAEILEQFRQDGTIHAIYSNSRTRAVEELRADLSYVLAGMLSQKEFAACAGRVQKDGPSPKAEE